MDPTFEKIAAFAGEGEDLALLEWAQAEKKKSGSILATDELLPKVQEHVFTRYISGNNIDTQENSQDIFVSHELKKKKVFLSRLAVALFGGLALIVPMLIMTLHKSLPTTLLTTFLFVVAVAVVLAWWRRMLVTKTLWLLRLRMQLYWLCLLEQRQT